MRQRYQDLSLMRCVANAQNLGQETTPPQTPFQQPRHIHLQRPYTYTMTVMTLPWHRTMLLDSRPGLSMMQSDISSLPVRPREFLRSDQQLRNALYEYEGCGRWHPRQA